MFSICKSESTKSSCRLLDLEPLKHSITDGTMEKDTLIIILIIIIIILLLLLLLLLPVLLLSLSLATVKKINKKKIIVIIYNYLSAIPRVDSLPRFHAQAWLSENTTIIINKKHTCKQNHTK